MANFYEALGIASSATEEEIKRAYRRVMLRNHPDKVSDLSEQEQVKAREIVNNAGAAYEILSDKDLKAIYDKNLRYGHETAFEIVKDEKRREHSIKGQKEEEAIKKAEERLQKLETLTDIDKQIVQKIDDMDRSKSSKTRHQDQKDLNELIKEHKALRKDAGVSYELGENSKIYKLLMSSNEKTVARLMDKMSASGRLKSSGEGVVIDTDVLVKHAPPELLLKMNEIAQKVEERKGGKVSSFKDGLNKFCNGLKRVFSFGLAGIGDKDIKDAIKELETVSKKFEGEAVDKGGGLKARAGRFAENINQKITTDIMKEFLASSQAQFIFEFSDYKDGGVVTRVPTKEDIKKDSRNYADSILDRLEQDMGKSLTEEQKQEFYKRLNKAYGQLSGEISDNLAPLLKTAGKSVDELANEAGKNTSFNRAAKELQENKEPKMEKGSAAALFKDAVSYAVACTQQKTHAERFGERTSQTSSRGV